MVQGSSSWMTLVLYAGSIPLLSFTYAVLYLAALHFDILPCSSVEALTSTKSSITTAAATALFALSVIQFIMWIGQAAMCTACEMAPILAGHQGQVPKWCPQSRFVDKGIRGLPTQLSTLALVKDSVSWVMVALSLGLVECARRQWARVRLMDVTITLDRDYETGWKKGVPMAGSNQVYEMGSLPKSDTTRPRSPGQTAAQPGHVEIGPPPSRKPTVAGNLNVGLSYQSRI